MEDFSKRLTRLKSQTNGWCFICENYLEHKSLFTWAKNSFCHKLWTSQFILWFKLFIWLPAMATPASMGHCNDLYGLKRYFVRLCHLTFCAILCQFLYLETRPDTRLPKSRAGGQGPYLRSLDHLGRSSGVFGNEAFSSPLRWFINTTENISKD